MLARKEGLPMPRIAFFSAMASPDILPLERPWRQQYTLSESDFQASPDSYLHITSAGHQKTTSPIESFKISRNLGG